MKKVNLDFSPIYENSIVNTLFPNISEIVVNGGGGLGGSRETIRGKIIIEKDNMGFMVVEETISQETVKINPRYVGTIRTINMTSVYFEHNNANFPSGYIRDWYTHKVGTEIQFVSKGGISKQLAEINHITF